jgi:FtsH-binding integral membrane protein
MDFTKYNTVSATSVKFDAGLRAYMLQVFNFMTVALIVTGITAFYASSEAFMSLIMVKNAGGGMSISPLGWVIQLAPLAMVLFLSYKIQSMSVQAAKITFWAYSILMGLSLGFLFYQYTSESIARAFFVTASVFGAMSIYGYTTKKDLTSFGSFLMMGVMGILLASVINIFMHSSAISFAVSVLGVLIFTGLTAYDTQKIKNVYLYSARLDSDSTTKMAIYGALTLYIDFINLFIMLLRFIGDRRN